MLKKLGFLLVLAMLTPLAAFASGQVDFTNAGGTLTGSSAGLSLTNSTLIAVNGLNGGTLVAGQNLGTLSFTTGALTSGSLQMGGTFAAGGTFTIVGNGINGVTAGTIFSGTFSGPLTWTLFTLPNGTHNYTLSGTLTGSMTNGSPASGVSVQLTVNTHKGFFNGKTNISSGDTNLTTVTPEPGTLMLFGTGLVGLAGVLRKRFAA
jgi:hypothetical protein